MAGDLHKPLVKMLEDERKAGYKIGKRLGCERVVEWIERHSESCEENHDFSIFPENHWQDFKKQLLEGLE